VKKLMDRRLRVDDAYHWLEDEERWLLQAPHMCTLSISKVEEEKPKADKVQAEKDREELGFETRCVALSRELAQMKADVECERTERGAKRDAEIRGPSGVLTKLTGAA
jgi:hypothetical protein